MVIAAAANAAAFVLEAETGEGIVLTKGWQKPVRNGKILAAVRVNDPDRR